jgi:transposase InsO family protein
MRRKAIMPWKEQTTMLQRKEMIEQARVEGANISALCRTLGISRKTAYKWLKREGEAGVEGLSDRSRRPQQSPGQTDEQMEEQVLRVRCEHPVWGGRKIRRVLQNRGCEGVPAASTITAILRRHDQIDPEEAQKHQPFQRFEREQPNELWQMDFKGYFALIAGGYCHPLTVIDDHSRFLVGLKACPNQTYSTVKTQLTTIFEQFGLPQCMLMDNGSPWGDDRQSRHTILTAWLLRLEIAISHGRPYHPQTQGKDERLNRTLLEEVITRYAMNDLAESQACFDDWQQTYNQLRPHEALQLDTPAAHYLPSPRPFPQVLPPVTYPQADTLRKVDASGKISFHNHTIRVGLAFRYQPVALRPSEQDGCFAVFFCKQQVAYFDLRTYNPC